MELVLYALLNFIRVIDATSQHVILVQMVFIWTMGSVQHVKQNISIVKCVMKPIVISAKVDYFYVMGNALSVATYMRIVQDVMRQGEDDKTCSMCDMKGYYIDSKNCKKCSATCIDCLSQTKCVSCIEGYYLENTTSEEMTEFFGRCTDCSTSGCTTCNSTSCITCEINKYIDEGGLCSVCKPDNDKCISCFIDENGNKKCEKCNPGFWIENFECVTCETCGSSGCSNKTNGLCFNCLSPNEVLIEGICQIDENCISIDTKTSACIACDLNYVLIGKRCVKTQQNTTEDLINFEGNYFTKNEFHCKEVSDSNCVLCLEEYYLKDLQCLKCDEILTNCIKCGLLNYSNYNEVYCDICTIGYFPEAVCKNCSEISGCDLCVNYIENDISSRKCTKCLDGYKLSNYTCQEISHCVSGVGESCVKCERNFLVSFGECAPCGDVVEGCVESLSNQCTKCDDLHYLNSDFMCVKCDISNCKKCDATQCVECLTNYTQSLDYSACLPCDDIPNCQNCDNKIPMKCNLCSQNAYFKTPETCEKCTLIPKCVLCTLYGECRECISGHYLDNDECHKCNKIDGCLECTATKKSCTKCNETFFLENGKCVKCKDSFANSVLCDQLQLVTCEKGYFIKKNRCVGCNSIFGCVECDVDGISCTKCQDGLNLFNNSGINECSLNCGISHCTKCSSSSLCNICDIPYVPDGGRCVYCWDKHPHCAECDSQSGQCTLCELGQYNLVDGRCVENEINNVLMTKSALNCLEDEIENVECTSCVKIKIYEYKKSLTEAANCSSVIYSCYRCNFTTLGDNKRLECLLCKTGYGFESLEHKKCVKTTNLVDSNGYIIHCKEGCLTCANSTNCLYSNTFAFTTRFNNEYLYNNHEFCQKYTVGFGCVECLNSINQKGICDLNDRSKYCSFTLEKNNTFKCFDYNEIVKQQKTLSNYYESMFYSNDIILSMPKNEETACDVYTMGRCLSCKLSFYLTQDSPPKCLPCSPNCEMCDSTGKCLTCYNGYYIDNEECVEIKHCAKKTVGGCSLCLSEYYLKDGKCHPLAESNCTSYTITNTTELICTRCKEEYVLLDTKCVEKSEEFCSEVDSFTSQCIVCNIEYTLNEYKRCVAIDKNECIHSSQYNCLQCKNSFSLVKDKNGDEQCSISESSRYCLENKETGCTKCYEGYFVDGKKCSLCDQKCKQCSTSATSCISCKFGYYNDSNGDCVPVGELAKKCKTFLPSGEKCAICKDGFVVKNADCIKCVDKCMTCANSSSQCIQCNTKGGYYEDIEFSTAYEKECLASTNLTNCITQSEVGCLLCQNGYYTNEYNKCTKCGNTCELCTRANVCQKCVHNYVLQANTEQCILWSNIKSCASYDSSTRKCSKCSRSRTVSENGDECIPVTNIVAIVLPIVFVMIFIVLIVVIFALIGFYIRNKKLENKRKELVNETLISDAKSHNITFFRLGDEDSSVVSSTRKIYYESEIPVKKPTSLVFLIGNEKKRKLKFQFTTKDHEGKYEVDVKPLLVTIKKGRAVEFTVSVTPLCTCEADFDVILTVLDMRKGESTEIKIPCSFASEASTALDPDELHKENKLGEGGFGIVYKGTFRTNVVAIKEMKQMSKDSMEEFEKEVAMLDKFRSEYVVHFYGAVFIPSKVCMVTEFAKFGSFLDLIKKRRNDPIDFKMRVKITLDSAKGLEYLHNNGILHRDVKPDNTLVVSLNKEDAVNGKLTDFGASRNINSLLSNMTFTKGIGTPVYMAPEVMNQEKYTFPADVYSFTIGMLEGISWKDPYPIQKFKFPWSISQWVIEGKRPEILVDNEDLINLIEQSWKQNPIDRLDIKEIVQELQKIHNYLN
ncbi:protein serine/threonine kinase, putative [Entamoeba invadens IP1]|uniref:Protein serine/threonine kinase, putative n=1 Tax=Entamoeba invadens IP1 TaxID=370355 RepID=A0A0A1TXM3_ENTIV|nr:protein serine/threonine kinase, putative [Entamoeba invadens IP1]ELP86105.1 protein serine/threonine kinase, putative [Entamoeba invadens IP1]|eukprot:XP_004185451.1 protein serine/threonine kinase, putative [Entamoeba invadens IP1]